MCCIVLSIMIVVMSELESVVLCGISVTDCYFNVSNTKEYFAEICWIAKIYVALPTAN